MVDNSEYYNVYGNYIRSYFDEGGNNSKFLWVHTFDPHYPYNPQKNIYENENLEFNETLASKMRNVEELERFRSKINKGEIQPSEDFFKYQENLYDSELKRVDEDIVGDLLSYLKDKGIYSESFIIVTSDHGECIGQRDQYKCGNHIAHSSMPVPLVIKFPNNRYSGETVVRRVGHLDVLPTIYDYLDLDDTHDTKGKSLIPAIRGQNNVSYDVILFRENNEYWILKHKEYEYRLSHEDREKYCIQNTSVLVGELYNLEKDPEKDVIGENPDKARRFKDKLCELHIKKLKRTYSEGTSLSESQTERLKNLGYL